MSADAEFQGSIDRSREALRRSMQDVQEDAAAPLPLRAQGERIGARREAVPGALELHPFFQGLLEALPPPGSEWPGPERQQWLETARNIFALMYSEPAGGSTPAPPTRLEGPTPFPGERSA